MKPLRFALIGVGNIASNHASAIQSTPDAELVAVVTRREEKGREFAAKFGGTYFSSYQEVLQQKDIDAVTLCTPHNLHLPMTLEAAAAGKHVMCEKPLARNVAECDQMIAACEQAHVRLGVIFQFRFEPLSIKLKALVESGKLGSIIWNSTNTIWYRSNEYYASDPWRRTWDGSGGGVLINQAIHMIDLMLWLSGMPKRITAQTRTLRHAIETEDSALVTLEYDGGRIGLIQATTAAYPGYPERLEIYGTKGSAVYHKGLGKLEWHLADPKEDGLEEVEMNSGAATHLSTNANSHTPQFQDFAQAIRQGRSPSVDGHEGRKSIEVIEAIYRSAQNQTSVELPI